ncbi:hypothetical protein BBO_03541 [Beauveria brongniartii RCEF 3172]|uniref:BTB domain-containing protein n=1 Tax=Beauveria brongniartii RCEF 3172 TaxID=1081107 RepID=A0A162LWD9_9HYPO|nr:hypothetical protein BBO_03541 [Beauveria brongniartii RCEF 3172]
MQPDSKQQTSYPPGKKPAAAAADMGPRLNSKSVRHHHHHSRSTPPSLSRSHTTAGALSRSSSCLFRSAAPPVPTPAPAAAAAAARLPQHTRSHTTASTLSRSCSSSHLFRSAAPLAAAAARPSPQHARSQSTPAMGATTTTVLVGRSRQPFIVDRRLLCAASPFFRDQLQMPNRYASSSSPRSDGLLTYRLVTLWLPGESTTMFGLFVEWLHAPRSFRSYLDDTAAAAAAAAATRDPLSSPSSLPSSSSSASPAQLLHWALVRLHLFAAHLGLAPLQDLAMDALQDLYLCCDWDISPGVVTYLYTRCEARPAARLRRWAVAMMAFSLAVADWHVTSSSGDDSRTAATATVAATVSAASATDADTRLRGLIGALPELAADYATHVRSMRRAALDMRFKNPQLRIPANALRNEKRAFGFRECSFHSHRRAVGQGACPHGASGLRRAETGSRLDLRTEEDDEGAEEDEEDEDEDEDDEDDDDTRQWEKEWADELMGWEWEEEGEDACVPTTSLRRPPRKAAPRGLIEKGNDGGGGSARLLMSKFGSYRAKCPLRKLPSRDSNLLPASV